MQTPNLADENFAALAALFPNAVTETVDENGTVIRAIDKDALAQEINAQVVDGREERYQFTWPDKRKSVLLANAPIAAALRPCREESVDFDTTENLYIEGDNLDVLKLLRETYLNRVKMIYIDPPYNTGHDFVYRDEWAVDSSQWSEMSGDYDEQGNRLVPNLDSNGRFHTDWLNMIYPRLRVARDLLTDDGAVFISINDNEVFNLMKICNEVYGESNFVADLVWSNKEGGGSSDSKLFRIKHEHILCYSKNIDFIKIMGTPVGNEERYKSSDEYVLTRGKYYLQKMGMGTIQYSVSLDYPIATPDGSTVMPADNNGGRKACWRWSKQKYEWGLENGFIEIKKDSSGTWTVYSKQYLNADNEGNIIPRTQRPMGIIDEYSSIQATKLLENMGLGSVFSYAKPIELIRYLCERITTSGDIILDFFSGSATTAHAVMQLNAEDCGNRKFIMVQLPEVCAEDSEAAKAGYSTICEIGKERIRRAGAKIVLSDQFSVFREEMRDYGCVKLSGFNCVAEGDGIDGGDLSAGKKVTEGGVVFPVGSDEKSGSFNSVEHSGRSGQKFGEGVLQLSLYSEGVAGGTGDTAANLREGRLPCKYGYYGSESIAHGDRKNADCPHFKTENCPLKTNNYPDIGFRVLKLDSSNMKDVYYTPEEFITKAKQQVNLDGFADNIKEDRSDEDLLFQVMLDLGIPLSAKITQDGDVLTVDENYLIACFRQVDTALITEIAQRKPYYAVFRDRSFRSDSAMVNFEQVFNTYSPQTIRKVL